MNTPMKKLVLWSFLSLFLSAGSLYAQEEASKTTTFTKKADDRQAQITFTEKEFNFEEVKEGEIVEHIFTFKNTGDYPLMLQDIRTTCGCTAPQWTKEPIAPNETGKIIIRFNSHKKAGQQRKIITVISNAANSSEKLVLYGTVVPNTGGEE